MGDEKDDEKMVIKAEGMIDELKGRSPQGQKEVRRKKKDGLDHGRAVGVVVRRGSNAKACMKASSVVRLYIIVREWGATVKDNAAGVDCRF